jgi:hypothetical protein
VAVKSFAVDVVCAGDFPHFHKGLCWSDKVADAMNWDDAMDYCEGLGGRLPKIHELRMLTKECPQAEYPKPIEDPWRWCEIEDPDKLAWDDRTEGCSGCTNDSSGKYSVFGDIYWFWSSSSYVNNANGAWGVDFSVGGYVNFAFKHHIINVRCVR